MPQVRNTRDALKRNIDQSMNLINTVMDYYAQVLGELVAVLPDESDMPSKIQQGYPADYRERMLMRIEMTTSILEGLELTLEISKNLKAEL